MTKIKSKLFLILSTILCLLFTVPVFSAPYVNFKIKYDGKTENYNKEKVYLYVNSKEIKNLPLEPIIFNNYTLVPARETFENFGAEVTWIKSSEQVQVVYKDMVVLMKINDKKATVNGELFYMDIPPKLINGKTMIPVRFVSEALGFTVEWDSVKRTINIKEGTKVETTTQSTTQTTQTTTKAPEKIELTIKDIKMPNSDENTFFIYADKEIKKYEKLILEDGSLAIDIYNSKNNIDKDSINSVCEYISKVDIENRENNVTRFIFKTKGSVLNNNFLLDDKKTLVVNFGGNSIKKVTAYRNLEDEYIDIYAEYPLEFSIEKNDTTNKIVLDIKNCSSENIPINVKDNLYIEDIKYNFIGKNELFLEVILKENVEFSKKQDGNLTTIILSKDKKAQQNNNNNNNNITSSKQFKISKKDGYNININNVEHTDDYINRTYVLDFNKDISNLIPNGIYNVDNDLVKTIEVSNYKINLNCKKITAVNITEDTSNIYINMLYPKEKYKNVVVIDPGHGGDKPGTTGNGLLEKDINLQIALKINKLFENNKDIKVYFTRLTDFDPSFDDRTNMSNEVADMFISIHNNSTGDGSTSANGTEVFYLNPNTSDRGLTSKAMAEIVQKNLLKQLGSNDRKIKTSNLIVLRNNKMPAILCEVGFLSNPEESKKLASDEYQQKAAQAIYDSIIEIIEKYPSVR